MWGDGVLCAGGKQLEYRCWGDAPTDGRCVVLLHEGLGCVALWKRFPQDLSEALGLPVMAYSRAGYGWSEADDLPRPLDWMTREARVLPEVLEAFGIWEAVLIGHSDGATIAAIAAGLSGGGNTEPVVDAADRAGRQRLLRRSGVRAAVLMAPHFFTEDEGLAEIARADAAFETAGLAERMGKYHRDPVATFRGWADAWLSEGFRDWNVEACLDDIRAPVLVIQGRDDQYGTLAQVEAVTSRVPGAEALILEDCRHVPHLEQTEAVLAKITTFMHNNAFNPHQ